MDRRRKPQQTYCEESSTSSDMDEQPASQKSRTDPNLSQSQSSTTQPSNVKQSNSCSSASERMKNYRNNMTPEEKTAYLSKARERMNRLRDRTVNDDGRMTRAQLTHKQHSHEQKRKKWRDEKRKQRAEQNKEAKQQELAKRRLMYSQKVIEKGKVPRNLEHQFIHVPDNPENYLKVVENLIAAATPMKKKLLRESNVIRSLIPQNLETSETIACQVVAQVQRLKGSRTAKSREKLRFLIESVKSNSAVNTLLRKRMKVRYQCWKKYESSGKLTRKKRLDALPDKIVKNCQEFYNDHSTDMPCKAAAGKKMLDLSTKKLHSLFQKENKVTISRSKFQSLRPKNIKLYRVKFQQCLCEYCLNVKLKLTSLSAIMKKEKIEVDGKLVESYYGISEATVCDEDNIACIERKCEVCGVKKLKTTLKPFDSYTGKVEWQVWENITVQVKEDESSKERPAEWAKAGSVKSTVPSGNYTKEHENIRSEEKSEDVEEKLEETEVKTVTKKDLVKKEGTIQELIEELCCELEPFSEHLFNSKWQRKQLNMLKNKLPSNVVLCVEDYAENFRTVYQDEPQSKHYDYNQVTVFNMVAYFPCPSCTSLVEEKVVFLSSDLKHDPHAVRAFEACYIKHLKEQNEKVDHMICYSDGAASQFKAKLPFHYLSEAQSSLGVTQERSFFGTRHGKSVCDALGGFVKNAAASHVASRKYVIKDAEELFLLAKEELSLDWDCSTGTHTSRIFFLVEDIVRPVEPRLIVLKGTQKIHDVKADGVNSLLYRKRSCFCLACLDGHYEDCENLAITGPILRHSLIKGAQKQKKETKENIARPENKPMRKKETKRAKDEDDSKPGPAPKKLKLNVQADPKENITRPQNKPMRILTVERLMNKLSKSRSFEHLKTQAADMKFQELAPIETSVVDLKKTLDQPSLDMRPKDMNQDLFPVTVEADGNCLPRCGSLIAFGSEDYHSEIRLRIGVEMALHQDYYLKKENICAGFTNTNRRKTLSAISFAEYSDMYVAGEHLTPTLAKEIFRKEIFNILSPGRYMGIWQIMALSSILHAKIDSVYPEKGVPTVRQDLHCQLWPRTPSTGLSTIMWTSTRTDMNQDWWNPNHFVLMLPLTLLQNM